MQIIKNINNNVVICQDDYGRELVVFGKGLGFQAAPSPLTDLSKIQRTFYNISPEYIGMLQALPSDVLELTAEVVDMARSSLPYALSPNLLLTLADHITFALKRVREGIYLKMPLAYDLEHMYPQEVALARKAVSAVKARFKVPLPQDEASGIAMAFLNARVYSEEDRDVKAQTDEERILDEITALIEDQMEVTIDRGTFNYARYATHVRYLLERLRSGKGIDSINADVYADLRKEYPKTAACVDRIARHLKERHQFDITAEEQLYLILHVNRVCANGGL